jgi:hypothetical protein
VRLAQLLRLSIELFAAMDGGMGGYDDFHISNLCNLLSFVHLDLCVNTPVSGHGETVRPQRDTA